MLAPAGWAVARALMPPLDLYQRYERYALWQIDNARPGIFRRLLTLPEIRPETNISEWEADYGHDPRYWQLRDQLWQDDEAAQFLAAIDRGTYDSASFDLISIDKVEELVGEVKALEFLDKAIASDPDNAWHYYRKTDYLISLGELDAAWEILKQGNVAPKCYYPLPFPLSEAYARLGKPRSRSQKAAIGYILGEELYPPHFTRMKDQYRNATVAFALGYPLEFGDDLLTRARRIGQSEDPLHITHLVGVVLASTILGYARDELLELTPQQQQQEYQAIRDQLDGAKQVAKDAGAESQKRLGKLPTLPAVNAATFSSNQAPIPRRGDYVTAYEQAVIEREYMDQYAAHFDCLDPSPLSIWARGKLWGEAVDAR